MKITTGDFEQLTINSTNWNGSKTAWKLQEGRFEDIDYSEAFQPDVDYGFARAYWVQDYPAVLFVKAFLEAHNFTYRVYWDTADDTYMVTTNYGGAL
jgi:hypothetical protein